MTCCDYGCTNSHGCAAHTTSLSIACCGRADCLDTHCPGRPEPQVTDGESNHQQEGISGIESASIWDRFLRGLFGL